MRVRACIGVALLLNIAGWSSDVHGQGLYQVVQVRGPETLTLALLSDLNNDRQGVGLGVDPQNPVERTRRRHRDR